MRRATTQTSGSAETTANQLDQKTTLDRYPLPGIDNIFNHIGLEKWVPPDAKERASLFSAEDGPHSTGPALLSMLY